MRAHEENHLVERSGGGIESSFVIKNSARAFAILSSTLYSDKIGAIIRELSCNAYDAHVAVDKKDVPFELKLPNSLDPTFYVKDFGPGLSDAQIIGEVVNGQFVPGIYQTFFDSSKTGSDDFIGALGLGCKSPFSYTSMFMIESRQNGVKRTYTAFKDEQNKPAIRFMNQEDTDESDGLTVSLSVKKDDINKFVSSAKKQLMYFAPMPKIKGYGGFSPYSIKHTTVGTNWKLRETDSYANMKGPHVIQGFVVYPVDKGILNDRHLPHSVLSMLEIDIDLYVPIGQVEPAPSREALSYDNTTVDNLVKALEVAAKEIHGSLQKLFDDCTTVWEANNAYNGLDDKGYSFREMFKKLEKMKPFTWKGKVIKGDVELILDKIVDTSILAYSLGRHSKINKLYKDGQWNASELKKTFKVYFRKDTQVLIDKQVKGNNATILKYLDDNSKTVGKVLVLRPTMGHTFNQAEVNDIVKQLGDPSIAYVENLAAAPAKKSTYTKRAPEEKLVWKDFPDGRDFRGKSTGKRREYSRLCWKREMIDLNAGGFYVNVERFTIQDKGSLVFDTIIHAAIDLGLIPANSVVVGFNEKDFQQVSGNGLWINLIAHIESAFKANQQDYLNFLAYSEIKQNVPAMSLAQQQIWTIHNNKFIDGDFKKFVCKLSSMIPVKSYNTESISRFKNTFSITLDYYKVSNIIKQEWATILRRYPMLTYVSGSSFNLAISDIAEYVNIIDKP